MKLYMIPDSWRGDICPQKGYIAKSSNYSSLRELHQNIETSQLNIHTTLQLRKFSWCNNVFHDIQID